jgi:hypothetical protein
VRDISIESSIRDGRAIGANKGSLRRIAHRYHDDQLGGGPAGIAVFVSISGAISELTAPGRNSAPVGPFATGKLSAAVRICTVRYPGAVRGVGNFRKVANFTIARCAMAFERGHHPGERGESGSIDIAMSRSEAVATTSLTRPACRTDDVLAIGRTI